VFDVNNTAGLAYTLRYEPPPDQPNRPPVLDPINNWTLEPGNRLGFPIRAVDPDGDQLTYTMVSGPANVALHPNTGFFEWRPDRSHSGTNTFTVQVTDNGNPALSDTRSFFVNVEVVLGFQLSLGATNIFTGESGAVPLVLRSELGLTNVSWSLTTPAAGGLTNLQLTEIGPEVYGYTVTQLGSNRYAFSLEVDARRVQAQTRQLASLGFQSLPVAHSTIVRLPADDLHGLDPSGQLVTNATSVAGSVVVLAKEPVLVAGRNETLTLFGRPGGSYAVESSDTAAPAGTWQFLERFPLTNRYRTFAVPAPASGTLYRGYEFEADPPLLEVGTATPGAPLPILVYGKPGGTYTLERGLTVDGQVSWTEVMTFTLVNSWRLVEVPDEAQAAVFRIREVAPPDVVRLDLLSLDGPVVTLRLTGQPGLQYLIEGKTELGTATAWTPVQVLTLTSPSQVFTWTNQGPASQYFRAVESSGVTRPFLILEETGDQTATLRLEGVAGRLYLIEAATNLTASVAWVPVQELTLTNPVQRLSIPTHGEPVRVFRARTE